MVQGLLHLEVPAVGVFPEEGDGAPGRGNVHGCGQLIVAGLGRLGQGDAAGGAELAQALEGVGHRVDAIARIHHQLRVAATGLPEVVPQDRSTDLPSPQPRSRLWATRTRTCSRLASSGATSANTGAEEARVSSVQTPSIADLAS